MIFNVNFVDTPQLTFGGFVNVSRTCYMASVLQLMNTVPGLKEALKKCNTNAVGSPVTTYVSQALEMISKGEQNTTIDSLAKVLGWTKSKDQDTAEFFSSLLERFEAEMGDEWTKIAFEMFGIIKETYWDSSITVTTMGNTTLRGTFESMWEPVITLHSNVMINLNRTKENGRDRDETAIEYPLQLDIGFALTGKSQMYDLSAVIVHWGSAVQGHYNAFVKNHDSWWLADDAHISQVTETEVQRNDGFFLATNLMYTKH